VDNQLESDSAAKKTVVRRTFLKPYFDWKSRLKERHGLSFGVDYSAVYLGAIEGVDENAAAGGMVRFYGSWDLVGRRSGNTGAFVWKLEHRHKYTAIAPSALGFDLGYAGILEPPFSDQGFRWTNFYWRQRLKNGRIALVAGALDPTDYIDLYGLTSPWTGFLNFAFSTGSNTIPVPNDAAFGAAGAGMVTKNLYLIGGLTDSNADPTDPSGGFDTFFSDREYFKHFEVGWTTSQKRIYQDNIHITLWHADERAEAGVASGWGAAFSAAHFFRDKWMPFLRGGYADDGGSLMQKSLSLGLGYQQAPGGSLLGVGVNWGEPNAGTFAPDLRDQYTAEVFYRVQISGQFALTPDIEFLLDPALNPDTDSIWVFGLRARIAI
jgi:porin